MNQPWECPRCKKMNAPWMQQCCCSSSTQLPKMNSGHLFTEYETCMVCGRYHGKGLPCVNANVTAEQ